LRIHTHVREDALSLYGFLTQDEKALFEKLIGVSGIGPKLAVTILSGLAAPDLIGAIRRGEVDKLVRIPGIGKKTAERMVLELREKMPAAVGEEPDTPAKTPNPPSAKPRPPVVPPTLNRSSGAPLSWYAKLVAHARPGAGFRRTPNRRFAI
jgi:Holliday junction resolvasome RuvABC DNA-binding subunit